MSRDARIGKALIDDLGHRFSLEEVAGLVLISLERLVRLDANAFLWALEHLIPSEVILEIKRISSMTLGKRLVEKGMVPGQDFSLDSIGNLLLNAQARATVFS